MEELYNELLKEAKILKIPVGTAETIAEKVVSATEKWQKLHPEAKGSELRAFLAGELKKYNADLAYLYQNRGKII